MIELWEEDDAGRVGTTLLDKFRVDRLIGSGGMGAVYEAVNLWTGRRVAIKVLRSVFARNQSILARFVQEARTATALQHPNIVDILDICRTPEGLTFIVQELLVGEDLRSRADRVGLPLAPSVALDMMVPIMGALVAVHRAGVIHRDIKPDNIFIVRDGRGPDVPKLIDFGVSKVADTNGARPETQTGIPIGTPDYMAPEQARGESIDARVDVWAVGVVLFELLSGTLPYREATPNLVLASVMTRRPPSLASVAPQLPPSLVRVIDRALSFDAAGRWPSMSALLSALLDCEHTGYDRSAAEARHPASLAPLAMNTANILLPTASASTFAIELDNAPSFGDPLAPNDESFDDAPTQYRSLDALTPKLPAVGAPTPALVPTVAAAPPSSTTPMIWGDSVAAPVDHASRRLRAVAIFLGLLVMALGGGLTGVVLSLRRPPVRPAQRVLQQQRPAQNAEYNPTAPDPASGAPNIAATGHAVDAGTPAPSVTHVPPLSIDASVRPARAATRSIIGRPQPARGLRPQAVYE